MEPTVACPVQKLHTQRPPQPSLWHFLKSTIIKYGLTSCRTGLTRCIKELTSFRMRLTCCRMGLTSCRSWLTNCRKKLTSCRMGLTSCKMELTNCREELISCRMGLTSSRTGLARLGWVDNLQDGADQMCKGADQQ